MSRTVVVMYGHSQGFTMDMTFSPKLNS